MGSLTKSFHLLTLCKYYKALKQYKLKGMPRFYAVQNIGAENIRQQSKIIQVLSDHIFSPSNDSSEQNKRLTIQNDGGEDELPI